MKRIAWLALAALLLQIRTHVPAAAKGNPYLYGRVEIGYGGYCHATIGCPVRITLSDEEAIW